MTQFSHKEIAIQNPLRYERLIIIGLCAAAAIRVFIFCAAFPFFNNVDELSHFDVVFKYSHGHLPAGVERYDAQATRIIADNVSTEFLIEKPLKLDEATRREFAIQYEHRLDLETWAWPSYYMLAGAWCRIGQALGLESGSLLYWLRFLNIPIAAALVWLSWLFSCKIFDTLQKRLAVPILAAFFPQDIFYAITSDVLSPLVFAISLIMLLEIYIDDKTRLYYLVAGLFASAAFLNKATNVAIVVLAIIVLLVKLKKAFSQKGLKNFLPRLTIFAFAFGLPVAFWLGRNYTLFGDFSGATSSMTLHTWTPKPLSEIFDHPIFSLRGTLLFLEDLTSSFWRGEIVWLTKRMSLPLMDGLYSISSGVLLVASFFGFAVGRKESNSGPGTPNYLFHVYLSASVFVVILSIAVLAILSVRYDFGRCIYPSRIYPYFTSGRLIAGVMLPFLFLYVEGLNRLLSKVRLGSYLLPIVVVIAVAITVSEVVLTLPVFSSPSNWFHLQ